MDDKETEAFLSAIADLPDTLARGRDGTALAHLDPDTARVCTGLGGEGERLRYLVIAAATSPPLDEDAIPALRSLWDRAAQAHNSAVESLDVAPHPGALAPRLGPGELPAFPGNHRIAIPSA